MSESMEAIQQKFLARMLPESHLGESTMAPATTRSRKIEVDDEVATLVHQIYLKERAVPLHTVLFSGLEHGNGCTRISSAAATILARTTGSVCLVETNFHTPSQAAVFGIPKHAGFSDALMEDRPIGSYVRTLDSGLHLLQAGLSTTGASIVLVPDRVKDRLAQLRAEFRYVILDAAPLTYVETLMLGHLASGVVMICEADRTRREDAISAAKVLRSSDIEILGAVLNKRTLGLPAKLYAKL